MALLLVGAAVAGTAGCSGLAERSARKELVVVFQLDVKPADIARVRAACVSYPGVSQEPVAVNESATNRLYPLRYDITTADTPAFADLARCLTTDPAVRTYTVSGGVGGS